MMSTQPIPSIRAADAAPDAVAVRPSIPMAGTVAELVAARESKGLSAGDIAGQLKLAPRQVMALERGDWAALPGPAFVRGALRAYGRAVGIGVDGLLATLDDVANAAVLRPSTSLEAPMPSGSMLGFGSGGGGSKTAWLILGAVLLLALALFFGRDTDFSTIPSLLPERQAAPAKTSSPDVPAVRPGVEQIPTLPQTDPAAGSSGSATSAAPIPAAPGAPVPASALPIPPPTQAVSASDRAPVVRLQFDRETWVDIKQADGRNLLYGPQKAGTEVQLPLVAEMSLLIGNADNVRVARNGDPVDIKSLARQGVARLTLNP